MLVVAELGLDLMVDVLAVASAAVATCRYDVWLAVSRARFTGPRMFTGIIHKAGPL